MMKGAETDPAAMVMAVGQKTGQLLGEKKKEKEGPS